MCRPASLLVPAVANHRRSRGRRDLSPRSTSASINALITCNPAHTAGASWPSCRFSVIRPSPRSRVRHAGPASGPHVPPACPARVRPAQAVPSRAARRTRSSDRSCSQRFPVCSGVLADTHDQPRGRSQAGDGHPTSTNTGGTSTLTGTMKLRGSHSWLAGRRTQQVDDVSLEIHRRCQGL